MIIMVVCCLKSHWLSACFDWPLCHVEGTTYVAHINKPACGSTSAGGAQRCRAATVAPCLVSLVKWCQARNSWVQRTYFQRTWKNIKRFDDFDVHGEFISKTLSCGPENCHCHSLSLSRLEFAKLIRRCWTVTNSTLKTYEDIISYQQSFHILHVRHRNVNHSALQNNLQNLLGYSHPTLVQLTSTNLSSPRSKTRKSNRVHSLE